MKKNVIQDHEKPVFDCGEWTACTRHGMVWYLFSDERNKNPDIYLEALQVVEKIIVTGNPPFGSWR